MRRHDLRRLDDNLPIAHAMFRRRAAGYKELGYRVELPQMENDVRPNAALPFFPGGFSSHGP